MDPRRGGGPSRRGPSDSTEQYHSSVSGGVRRFGTEYCLWFKSLTPDEVQSPQTPVGLSSV